MYLNSREIDNKGQDKGPPIRMSDQDKELPGTAATKKSNAGRSRTYDPVGFEQTLHDPANKLVVAGRTGRSLMHPQEGVTDPQDRRATVCQSKTRVLS